MGSFNFHLNDIKIKLMVNELKYVLLKLFCMQQLTTLSYGSFIKQCGHILLASYSSENNKTDLIYVHLIAIYLNEIKYKVL